MYRLIAKLIFLILSPPLVFAAQPRAPVRILPPVRLRMPPLTFQQLILNAGYVFEGTVVSVQEPQSAAGEAKAIQISFRVVRGVRGVQAGQIFTIREWAGLWNVGERYRPGQKVVLFLYRPSRLGLTSPVGGPLGRFGVDATGQIMLNEAQNALFSGQDTQAPVVKRPLRIPPAKFFQNIRREAAR